MGEGVGTRGDKDAGRAHDAEWRRHGGGELGNGFRGEYTKKHQNEGDTARLKTGRGNGIVLRGHGRRRTEERGVEGGRERKEPDEEGILEERR